MSQYQKVPAQRQYYPMDQQTKTILRSNTLILSDSVEQAYKENASEKAG